MANKRVGLISVVVPAYNEASGLTAFHQELIKELNATENSYEVIYCDDGSTDNTAELVSSWHSKDARIRLVKLSRNFGKESALAAGIDHAQGDAIILIDADGQHPISLIPKFIEKWQSGARIVVGLRTLYEDETWFKIQGSKLFYKLFNKLSEQPLVPGSTDFRLISRSVAKEFLDLKEVDRINRGLIDWLGFSPEYIRFTAKPRQFGEASYSKRKLLKLAANSFVSLTSAPIYLFGYLGVVITLFSFLLGSTIFTEQLILEDPLNWNFTGTAMLGILTVFLVGLVLLSQGIMAVYISHIHNQSKQRPLFVVDYESSAGVTKRAR